MVFFSVSLLLFCATGARGEPDAVGLLDILLPISETIGGLATTEDLIRSPKGRLIPLEDLDKVDARNRPAVLLTIDRRGTVWMSRPNDGKAVELHVRIPYGEVGGALKRWWAGQPSSATKDRTLASVNLVLRADARAPWLSAVWIMRIVRDQETSMHRVFLAVQDSGGKREGHLAMFLPTAGSGVCDSGGESGEGPTIDLQLRAGGRPWSTADAVYSVSLLLEGLSSVERARAQAVVSKSRLARVGDVVRLVDCGIRAGITQFATGGGDVPDLPESNQDIINALNEVSVESSKKSTALGVWVNGTEVRAAPNAFELPPVESVGRGLAAGSFYVEDRIIEDK